MSLQSSLSKRLSSLFHSQRRRRRNRQTVTAETLECRQLLAADFTLVNDLNTVDNVARSPGSSVIMDGILYFEGSTAKGGSELWRSDGTDAGTFVVAHVQWPTNLLVIGSTLYFTADDGTHGRELWKTNGTASGTVMVKDIAAGLVDSSPESLTNANGVLYFSAKDGVNGRELWKSNGTSSGTAMVHNLNTSANGDGISDEGEIVAVGSTVYFAGHTLLTGTELYKSDGTSAGTKLVRDVSTPGLTLSPQSSAPKQLTRVGAQVYFVTETKNGTVTETGLWVTNGTASGTSRISLTPEINSLTAIGTSVYYESWGSLYRINVQNGLVIPLLVKQDVGNVSEIRQAAGVTYFSSKVKDFGPGATRNFGALWRTDGTSSGTQELRRFEGNLDSYAPAQLVEWKGALYFQVLYGGIWKSTGTAAGTTLQNGLSPGREILGATSTRLYLTDGIVLASQRWDYCGDGDSPDREYIRLRSVKPGVA